MEVNVAETPIMRIDLEIGSIFRINNRWYKNKRFQVVRVYPGDGFEYVCEELDLPRGIKSDTFCFSDGGLVELRDKYKELSVLTNPSKEQIIQELEKVHGVELGVDFDAGENGLCNDGDCYYSDECVCRDNFREAVDAELERSKLANAAVPCQHKDTRGGECLRCGKAVVTKSVLEHYQELERLSLLSAPEFEQMMAL